MKRTHKDSLYLQRKFSLIALLLLFIQSCGLFDTREVEPPNTSRSTFIQPTSADIVLANLSYAIAEKNLDNYMRCFVDTNFSSKRFRYYPDAISQSSFPVFLNWNLTAERNYYSNLLSFTPQTASSNLFPDNVVVTTAIDSTIIDMDYIFVFDHSRANIAKQASGKLRFIMGVDTRGLWSIHTWYDFLNSKNDTTWSFIKASFVN